MQLATSERAPSPDEIRRQVDRITQSAHFRESASLQKLVRFITDETLDGHREQLRETVIGIRVFERGEDFDGKTDNVVRVQAHRLRRRLKEYYQTEGRADEIVVEIPKGHYVPRFNRRSEPDQNAGPAGGGVTSPERAAGGRRANYGLAVAALMVGIALGVLGYAFLSDGAAQPGTSAATLDPALGAFWGDYLQPGGVPAIAVLPNHVFLETADTFNLLYYTGPEVGPTGARVEKTEELKRYVDPALLAATGPLQYNSNLVAAGDSQGVISLVQMFTRAGSNLLVKRSRLLNVDELETHNVIFIGGEFGHGQLASVWGNRPFSFDGATRIVNHSPLPGEAEEYRAAEDPATGVRLSDHGLIGVLPGLGAGKKITVLGGLRTEGSYAAARFATDPASVGELIDYFGGELPEYFQAVVRCDIVRERVSKTLLVTGRVIQ